MQIVVRMRQMLDKKNKHFYFIYWWNHKAWQAVTINWVGNFLPHYLKVRILV